MTTILITGSTDGIGLETALEFARLGHRVVLHGRSAAKLEQAEAAVRAINSEAVAGAESADLSQLVDVDRLAAAVGGTIDVLINNAGVFSTSQPIAANGLDVRFMVNTIAPYRLTQLALAANSALTRVVNLSSAAQAPVDLDALAGLRHLPEMEAYAQSKLALTMWTSAMAAARVDTPDLSIVSVNPGSLLATKMVKEGFGVPGKDITIGVDILVRAALSDEFGARSGAYFDNDAQRFAEPHPAGRDEGACAAVVAAVEAVIDRLS